MRGFLSPSTALGIVVLFAASSLSAQEARHPLTGRIWDEAARTFIDESELLKRLSKARFVLLGEKHDNADHHALQARVVRALGETGARYAVCFEPLPAAPGPDIPARVWKQPISRPDLERAWNAAGPGSPFLAWSVYKPVVEAALDSGFDVHPADLSRTDMGLLHRKGWGALNAEFVARYQLDRPVPESVLAAQRKEVVASHCGYDPGESSVDAIINVGRARDAAIAESLSLADRGVLIAGLAHTRSDSGVPAYLALRFPITDTVSISLTETVDGLEDPSAYVGDPEDYLWFTPPWERQEPCAEFQDQLKKMQKRP